jgi:hypothetical protein
MQTNQRDLSPSRARKQAVSQVRRQAPGPAFSTEHLARERANLAVRIVTKSANPKSVHSASSFRLLQHRLDKTKTGSIFRH